VRGRGDPRLLRDFHEQLWEHLPEEGAPYDLPRRRGLLLAHAGPGDRVLDLGCGDGDLSAVLPGVVGVDVAEAAVRRARRRHPGHEYVRADAEDVLPFADASFDVVWCSEVLEHLADTGRALGEARRVLRAGGRLLVTTPYHGRVLNVAVALTRFEAHFDPRGDHLRFYTARSLRDQLADHDFTAVAVRGAGGVPAVRRGLHATARAGGGATP